MKLIRLKHLVSKTMADKVLLFYGPTQLSGQVEVKGKLTSKTFNAPIKYYGQDIGFLIRAKQKDKSIIEGEAVFNGRQSGRLYKIAESIDEKIDYI